MKSLALTLALLVLLPFQSFAADIDGGSLQPMTFKAALKTLTKSYPDLGPKLTKMEKLHRAGFKMASGTQTQIIMTHANVLVPLFLQQHVLVSRRSAQGESLDVILKEMQNLPTQRAMHVVTKTAKDLFRRLKIKPSQEFSGGRVYSTETINLALLDLDDRVAPYIFAKNQLLITPMYVLSKSGHQLAPIGYNNDIALDFSLVVNNNHGMAEFSFYAGRYGQAPFTASRKSYLLFGESYESVCAELGCTYNNDYGFVPLFSDTFERLGFLYEAHEWMATELPGLELTAGVDAMLLEYHPIEDNNKVAEQNEQPAGEEITVVDDESNLIAQEIHHLLEQEQKRFLELRAKKLNQKAQGRRASLSTPQVDDATQEITQNTDDMVTRIERGRKKFRQIRKYVNQAVKNSTIISRQEGSHIVLSSASSTPVTIVKRHGKKKTLSANEVQELLTNITNMGK